MRAVVPAALFVGLFAVGCGEPPPVTPATDLGPPIVLPTVEGMVAAEDMDEAPDCVEYELHVGTAEVELEPGVMTPVWAYNGLVPGPLLQARVGQHVHVKVTNDLDEATTIHWHGLRISNEMDGVVHGELKPIEPGETFTYKLTPPEAGTFWYHPHVRPNEQIERGLYGMFVVHEAEDVRPSVDVERGFIVDDVLLNNDGSLDDAFGGGMETMHGRYGNALLMNGQDSVMELKAGLGTVERWRITNSANARTMYLRFTGLVVKRIGADGGLWPQSEVQTINGDLELPVGARADLEVRFAPRSTEGKVENIVLGYDENDEIVEFGIEQIHVTRDPAKDAVRRKHGHFADPTYEHVDASTATTKRLTLSGQNTPSGVQFTINGSAWPEFDDWSVQAGELQVLDIRNELGMEHPFHLHGQLFTVVDRNGAATNEPGLRDTILVPGGARVRIATRFENPGMWMYHCHILEHEEAGMMAMVDVQGDGAMPMDEHESE